MKNAPTKFDDFWQASELDAYNIEEFTGQIDTFAGGPKSRSLLTYPSMPINLPKARNRACRVSRRRRSGRSFGRGQLSRRRLAELLAAGQALGSLEHRAYPSAGGIYALEIYVICWRVAGCEKQAYYYNPDLHALSRVAAAPVWSEVSRKINIEVSGSPQAMVLLVLAGDRLLDKYGERGGRFALIEAGAVLQQLSLNAAATRLEGVALGGLVDDFWLKLLRLDPKRYKLALGYLCGK